MDADFLQASLYTSVVAFGVAFLISMLGVIFFLIGLSLHELDRRTRRAEATADANEPAPVEPEEGAEPAPGGTVPAPST